VNWSFARHLVLPARDGCPRCDCTARSPRSRLPSHRKQRAVSGFGKPAGPHILAA
jgi:hypothetical protein